MYITNIEIEVLRRIEGDDERMRNEDVSHRDELQLPYFHP